MLLIPLALAAPVGPAPAGWTAVSAEWTVTIRVDEPVRLTARYTLASVDAHAEQLTLVGPELLVTDAPGPVVATPGGLGMALNPDRTRIEQRIEGLYIPDTAGSLSLGILRAARTHVTIDAPGLDVVIPGAVQGWLPPTDRLSVSWVPHAEGEPTHVRAVVQGESATTFRGDAGAIAVDSVLRWKVLRGEMDRFTFDAAGLEELDVAGPNVASWERLGQTVTIRTSAPVKGLFAITVRGRGAPGGGERGAPTPIPTGVNRVDRYVTMARSDEGELIPLGAPPSVALGRLPEWARNLGEAAPLAAWHGAEAVRVLVATVEVLSGPGTIVTAARYTLAASRDGRAALRMNLRVRNERRQYLHLVPPTSASGGAEGAMRWRPIVIRVANQPKSWLSDGAGGIYVPLERSVETVRGPLSFPVDIEWIGDGAAWGARGEQSLQLPSIDAPVQAATWEVHLPRGYARVGAPKGGGSEGFVLTDLRAEDLAAERKKEEVVSSALQNAVSAYRKNDFSGAERWLEEAKSVDDDNEEVAQLQSNLDVFLGRSGSTNDSTSRRIRDLAKAKNDGLADEQQELEKQAEDLLRAGDLDAAESRYGQALEVANKLQQTEQAESVEQKSKIEVAQNKLAEIADKKSTRDTASKASSGAYGKKGAKTEDPAPSYDDADRGLIVDEVQGLYAVPGTDGWGDTTTTAPAEPVEANGELDLLILDPGGEAGAMAFGYSTRGSEGSEAPADDAPANLGMLGYAEEEEPPAEGATMRRESSRDQPVQQAATRPEPPRAPPARGLVAPGSRWSGSASGRGSGAGSSGVRVSEKPASVTMSAPVATYAPPPAAVAPVSMPMAEPEPEANVRAQAGAVVGGLAGDDREDSSVMSHEERGRDKDAVAAGPRGGEATSDPMAGTYSQNEHAALAKERGEKAGERRSRDENMAFDMEKLVILDPAVASPPPPPPPEQSWPRVIERREALDASPSPMALAMPLDGPAVTTRQALLPGNTFPTWRLTYRRLPGEPD